MKSDLRNLARLALLALPLMLLVACGGKGFDPRGEASWYGPGFAGNRTANGEIFNPQELTAAHESLPFGTRVRVTNVETGASVVVRINDRFPGTKGRVIDLSEASFARIAPTARGVVPVELEVLSRPGQ